MLLVGASPPALPSPVEAEAETAEELAFRRDGMSRMTVEVGVAGRGPYRFLVDTGAERTSVSRELARELSLAPGQRVMLHSMSEAAAIETVLVPTLTVNKRSVKSINAPAFLREHIGADGILGVDSLKSQRVLFDFNRQTMAISDSRERERSWSDGDEIIVRARSRFGYLILADARVDGRKVWVIIDTGAQVSVGNEALRRTLRRAKELKPTKPIVLTSVTGGKIEADYTIVKRMEIGGVRFSGLPVAFVDAQPFRKLGLIDQPALLLGMESLRTFNRVSIDFAKREVRFVFPDRDGPRLGGLPRRSD
jgi:predicted aspartyl protease